MPKVSDFGSLVSRRKHHIGAFKEKPKFCEIPTHETADIVRAYTKLGHHKETTAPKFDKYSNRDEEYLMKKVCGEAYKNVLRDNERYEYMEQFMIRKPRKPKS